MGFVEIIGCYNRLMSPGKTHHAIAGQVILEKLGVFDISSIVGAHHGMPVDRKRKLLRN